MLMELWWLSAVLCAAAAGLAMLFARRSAAERHWIWCAAMAALLLLPAARTARWLPRYEAPAAVSRVVVTVTAAQADTQSPPHRTRPGAIAWWWVWLAGTMLLGGRTAWAYLRLAAIARRSEPWRDGTQLSGEIGVPLVAGLVEPVILLPRAATDWTREELDAVLAHERMHIARRDNWTQALAHLACAVFWPQPLVWLAARAMRNECERACDDGVLVEGTPASAYASTLVNIARAASAAVPAGGIAMARTTQLHRRIAALLNPGTDRRPAGRGWTAGAAALTAAFVWLAAGLEVPAFAQAGRLAGVVRDASGGAVPRARVDLKGTLAGAEIREVVYTNDAGEFALTQIPDGAYELSVAKPGFALLTQSNLAFESARSKPFELTLQIGSLKETIAVVGQGQPAAAAVVPAIASTTDGPKRIRVGGNVQAARLTHQVKPEYPITAKQEGVEGTVILRAIIGINGAVMQLETLNRAVDPRLVEAARVAVNQWRYSPVLLNGNPVEVITIVEVNFTLAR